MIYENEKTKNISFPLGGIGSGCVGLAGNGSLIDWEIFGAPNKQSINGYSHFALRVNAGGKTYKKILHGDTSENYIGGPHPLEYYSFGKGVHRETMAGYPHFKNVKFNGTFPTAKLEFEEDGFPVKAILTAFNPFIPHDEYDSSLPVAMFEWELVNWGDQTADCALAFSVQNPSSGSVNKGVDLGEFKGVYLTTEKLTCDQAGYVDLSVLCDGEDVVVQNYWYRGQWQDAPTTYWKNLSLDRLPGRNYDTAGERDHATVASYATVKAGKSVKVRFVLAWNAPVYKREYVSKDGENKVATWKNYYATQFASSTESAKYAMQNYSDFYAKTQAFALAMQSSSLPDFVIDAVSSNLSVLKSPTCIRLEDGTFWGWEGVYIRSGSCEGTCQHVWNYAYAMPFLFPRLERSIRESFEKHALSEHGKSLYRLVLPFENISFNADACVDGQMGEIIKIYREWKISGDGEWLKARADSVFKMLEYAWSEENPDKWDANCDGVLEGRQHHTLDMELFGPNSWLQGFYLLALNCGAEIADFVGDTKRSEKYRALYEKGKAWTNEHLFNGEYFMQKVDICDKSVIDAFNEDRYWNYEAKEIKYQVADGCIIDQVLADWHARIIGVPTVFDDAKRKTALKSIFKYNYKNMRDYANMWRVYALNDEEGTIMCSYPDFVTTPAIPISYVDEVMTGFEYAVAGLMIAEGMLSEGEKAVKAIRDRYDGEKRNPWNEIECGNNYARSMASYALMNVYSGFTFDTTKAYIGFNPVNSGDGKFVWSVASSWGTVSFSGKTVTLDVLGSPLTLSSLGLPNADAQSVTVDGNPVNFTADSNALTFEKQTITSSITVTLK